MMNSYVSLAIDLGGSGGKIIAGELLEERAVYETVYRFDNGIIVIDGRAYWDFLNIYKEIINGLIIASERYNGEIMSIGIDSWCNDYFLLTKNGTIIESPRAYRDKRTKGWIERAYAFMPAYEVYKRAGQQFARFETCYQLLAQKNEDPELLSIAKELIFFPDYLTYLLGAKKYTEYTVASVTNLFNITKGKWDIDMLSAYNINPELFQKVVPSGTPVGYLDPHIGKFTGIGNAELYAVGSHDTACAVAAVPCTDDEFLFISSGTWSLVGAELKKPVLTKESMKGGFGNEGGVFGTTRFIRNVMGLWIIQECSRIWKRQGKVYDYAQLAEGARQCGKVSDIFIDPDDERLFEPADMPEVIHKMLEEQGYDITDEFEITRIVSQSLACKYRYVIDLIEKITGKEFKEVYVIGGGSNNVWLNELTAQFTGKTVIAGPADATGIGNVAVQWVGSEIIEDLKEARRIIKNSVDLKEYKNTDKKYEELYEKFLKVVEKES